jgi:hypothetical protein
MGGKIERVFEFFSDLDKQGGQEEEIHWVFVGGQPPYPPFYPVPL